MKQLPCIKQYVLWKHWG